VHKGSVKLSLLTISAYYACATAQSQYANVKMNLLFQWFNRFTQRCVRAMEHVSWQRSFI